MLGLTVAKRKDLLIAAEAVGIFRPPAADRGVGSVRGEPRIVVDTSAIIDGRIAEIVESGFIYGTLVIPRFVLDELQHIADSSDALRRNRGRRGLEILNRMQKEPATPVEIVEDDVPEIAEVDAKLVALALARSRVILTNDYNLNRVAELQGVRVMNINSLANAVKPAVLPGEELRVRVIQEGKEAGPGRRLPRRRDDDRGRGRRAAHRSRARRVGDARPPDRGRTDDLRPATARLSGPAGGVRRRRHRRRRRAHRRGWADATSWRSRSAAGRSWPGPSTRWPRRRRLRGSSSSPPSDRRPVVAAAPWLPAVVIDVVAGGDRRQESVRRGSRRSIGPRPTRPGSCSSTTPPGRSSTRRSSAPSRRRPPNTGRRSRSCPSRRRSSALDGDLVGATVDRSDLGAAQTPQGVRRDLLREAYRRFPADGPADLHR